MSGWTEEEKLVKVYNWACDIYLAARPGGRLAALDLAISDAQAAEIDHAFSAIADAAGIIMRELSPELPCARRQTSTPQE